MLRTPAAVLALAILTACGGSAPDTQEEAARIAFEALKSGDFDGYEPLLPTEDDLDWRLDAYEEELGAEKAEKMRRRLEEQGGPEKILADMRKKCRDRFSDARKESALAFDWSSAEFAGVTDSSMRIRMDRGVAFADILFNVKAGGTVHVFHLNDCMKTGRGWVCGSGMSYRGPKRPDPADDRAQVDAGTIRLARVGTIGDPPEESARVVVNVNAEGGITVRGRRLELAALGACLGPLADSDRERDDTRSSSVHAVLRLDRTVPWRVVAWLMQTCADPHVRMYRLHFAVLPEKGDEEGTMAAFLPIDRGLSPTDPRVFGDRANFAVSLRTKGPPVEPAALYARARRFSNRSRAGNQGPVQAELIPDPLLPVGYLLRVMDVLHRAGVDRIIFRGSPPPRPGLGIQETITEARSRKVTPGIMVDNQVLEPPDAGYPELPPVARVRGRSAGNSSMEEPPLVPEELIESDIDEPVPAMRDGNASEPDEPDMPFEESPGEGGLISDAPFSGPATNSPIGGGAGSAFGGRGGHRNLVAHSGGSKKTQDAVDLGLEWLKDHQDPGGFWDCDGFMKMDKVTPICDGAGAGLYDPGVSGLALLAFLGAGETHDQGRYRKTVGNGLMYLKEIQDSEGCFGPRTSNHFTYNHSIATLAMAEAYGLTLSPRYLQSAKQAINFVHKCQNPYLAWRYGVKPMDNDTSVSGWMMCALKSAKLSDLRVDPTGFEGMKNWLDKVTDPESGRVGYTSRGTGPERLQELRDRFPADRSEALTAVGILSRILLGEDPRESKLIRKGTDLCLKALPTWDEESGAIDMYYWYYGSLALFQVGGSVWDKWNDAMKPAILDHQRRDGAFRGSWDPIGPWGAEGGRVYSTALMVMCMEVYYRHRVIFGAGK